MLKYIGLLFVVLLVGCNSSSGPKTVNASGVVLLDSNPVDMAQVTFIDDAGQITAIATTDSAGKFSLMHNGEKNGAVPGSYKVQVSKTKLTGNEGGGTEITISHGLPPKYASIATSNLTQVVPDSGISDIKIELSSK